MDYDKMMEMRDKVHKDQVDDLIVGMKESPLLDNPTGRHNVALLTIEHGSGIYHDYEGMADPVDVLKVCRTKAGKHKWIWETYEGPPALQEAIRDIGLSILYEMADVAELPKEGDAWNVFHCVSSILGCMSWTKSECERLLKNYLIAEELIEAHREIAAQIDQVEATESGKIRNTKDDDQYIFGQLTDELNDMDDEDLGRRIAGLGEENREEVIEVVRSLLNQKEE